MNYKLVILSMTILLLISSLSLGRSGFITTNEPNADLNEGIYIIRVHAWDGSSESECFQIENDNRFTCHLEGWIFKECNYGTTYRFPDVDIKGGKILTVYTGFGTPTEDTFFLNMTNHMFTKNDHVKLYCSCGNLISEYDAD